MPKRLFLALILLVAAPLLLLGWLSASTHRQREAIARERLSGLLQSKLAGFDEAVVELFDLYANQLEQVTQAQNPLQTLQRNTPVVRAVVLVDAAGNLTYPPLPVSQSTEERSLYAALPALVDSRPSLNGNDRRESREKGAQKQSGTQGNSATEVLSSSFSGNGRWQIWFMDEGAQLIYWQSVGSSYPRPAAKGSAAKGSTPKPNAMLGILLERSRWIADLTGRLPDGDGQVRRENVSLKSIASRSSGFVGLVDERGRLVYRWGDRSDVRRRPIATRGLPPPLGNWQFELHDEDPIAQASNLSLWISLAGIGVLLLTLGGYVLTGVRRHMDDARRRVSFASQVSHELRTPLTNIRLYAELAQSDLDGLPADATGDQLAKRLDVIDSESRRLGRLVSGVLEVIRDGGKERPPHRRPHCPDQVIIEALRQFEPSFEALGFKVEVDLNAHDTVLLDSDLLEMILVNLFSNVEKYAASGRYLKVESSCEQDQLVIRVVDHGPGIAKRFRRTIFKPFVRLDDSISSPSGTGIGLTIAQRLAHRHQGTLSLLDEHSDRGATFELCLPAVTPQDDHV